MHEKNNIIIFMLLNFSMQLIMGEEVALSKLTLMEVINKICDGVQARAELGLYSPSAGLFARLAEHFAHNF